MHAANIDALKVARIDYAGLAGNHTLDLCEGGLLETVRTVKGAGIAFAGAGESREEVLRPAVLRLTASAGRGYEVHFCAATDHPQDWSTIPTFHFIDYTPQIRTRLKLLLTPSEPSGAVLRIFSIHGGPNYFWHPAQEIRNLAHFLIDECNIDIIHGHSSHHVQGVEKYKGKLIIYGCGDFVDDYALVPGWRNDLSAVWRVSLLETDREEGGGLKIESLEVMPTKIESFRVRKLEVGEDDAKWVCEKVRELSRVLATTVDIDEGMSVARLQFS